MTFRPSVKFPWMDFYFEAYDNRLRNENFVLHLVVILMYTDGFQPPVTEG